MFEFVGLVLHFYLLLINLDAFFIFTCYSLIWMHKPGTLSTCCIGGRSSKMSRCSRSHSLYFLPI
jgi:hypothetical protein